MSRLTAATLILALAGPLGAAGTEGLFLGMSVGPKIPAGPWRHQLNTGIQAGLSAGYGFDRDFSLQADLEASNSNLARSTGLNHVNEFTFLASVRKGLARFGEDSLYLRAGAGLSRFDWDQDRATLTPGPGGDPTVVDTRYQTLNRITRPTGLACLGFELPTSRNTLRFELRYQRSSLPGVWATSIVPAFSVLW